MRPCIFKTHISAQMLCSTLPTVHFPSPCLLYFPTLSLAPSLCSLEGRAGMGWECFSSTCHRTPPPSPWTSVVSLRRVNLGSPKLSMAIAPKVTLFSKVRCRMDVRKFSLAFGVTHVVYVMCYMYEQTPAGYGFTVRVIANRKRLCGPRAQLRTLGPIHTMRHVSVPSPFHLRSVRMVCVHTVRRIQSPSRTARERRPAIISIKYSGPFVF